MKKQFFLLFIFIVYYITLSSQNRYQTPIPGQFINTYVSPDWNALIKIAKEGKEDKSQKALVRMQQIESQYKSFPKYPAYVDDGWHNAIIMNELDFCSAIDVYVENNIIIHVREDTKVKVLTTSFPINNGLTRIINKDTDVFTVIFLDYISKYNSQPQSMKRVDSAENQQEEVSYSPGIYNVYEYCPIMDGVDYRTSKQIGRAGKTIEVLEKVTSRYYRVKLDDGSTGYLDLVLWIKK